MFRNYSYLLADNPDQLNYGVAVTDVDGDGAMEFFVCGFGFPNLILKWDGERYRNVADNTLADASRQSIGIAAGDMDGDGREEIYVLNTDTFAGRKMLADRLWKCENGTWHDLFEKPENREALNLTAGRSVACVDRNGTGRYGFFVANYGGPMCLYEVNARGRLENVAPACGLALVTGGRSLLSLPLISNRMDIFAGNENGPNFLFQNEGNGTFREVAEGWGIDDASENARGVAVLDANNDGRFDILCGNWEGAHRLFVQTSDRDFIEVAPEDMAYPSRVRTVIVADFDNDGQEELFFNNIGEPNCLFGFRNGGWEMLAMGDALEPDALGTGAAVADLNGDGRLELLVAHGESGMEPLALYGVPDNGNGWLRVLPLTLSGAPARGAIVILHTNERTQQRAIDAGSGYLCQMEPVAHFGLGRTIVPLSVEVRWPDGMTAYIQEPEPNTLMRIAHPLTNP